ncbi:class I SAM-dependent methyltransferase [Arenimonas oryziterrae]|uniref:Methyltransferase type 11 domain-containing protein n=1 Tax=Arenimonas oryziterrae DSM 21050 = YC6267 TaxID=1121015 RepID=A0A091AWY4_9GAMM|nr:class I SAM-dependent methyltransferase [Arenimonas oryziterrae]KFN43179.1 hypothetical protein N789_11495 [Arenimonas oryziterrae DSM 21050 = YC6267]
MSDAILPFTGERFTPECVREIAYEHWHRYAFARTLARGRRVLDAACGEGFGSALLAGTAVSVLGVDIDTVTVAHARARYGAADNLRFDVADATMLDALPSASFDLIVSFETLEHVQAQEQLLDGFARLLAPGGLLLVSTPDKRQYTDATGVTNPHHVRELYREEFEALLAPRFSARRLFGQKLAFVSLLRSLDGAGQGVHESLHDGDAMRETLDLAPMYFLAACAHEAAVLDRLPGLALYVDADESVYADYNQNVRSNQAAARHIAWLEQEVERLRAQVAAASPESPGP